MQADIPDNDNPFLKHFFLSPDWVRVGRESANHVLDLWRSVVAKDSGALAATGRVASSLGGDAEDRIVFDVVVGEGTPRGGYGAAHNFGIGIHPDSRVPPTNWMPQPPSNDLVRVLAIVDAMSASVTGNVSG